MEVVDDGTESLLTKLPDKAVLSETSECVKGKITFIGEQKKLEKISEKHCFQFWKDSFSFYGLRPE